MFFERAFSRQPVPTVVDVPWLVVPLNRDLNNLLLQLVMGSSLCFGAEHQALSPLQYLGWGFISRLHTAGKVSSGRKKRRCYGQDQVFSLRLKLASVQHSQSVFCSPPSDFCSGQLWKFPAQRPLGFWRCCDLVRSGQSQEKTGEG